MNTIKVLLFCSFILLLAGCSHETYTVISITHDNGDRQNHVLISSDSTEAFNVLNDSKNFLEPAFTDTKIISKDAVKYISSYLIKNCNNNKLMSSDSNDIFKIALYSNKRRLKCGFVSKSLSSSYFGDLIQWVNGSVYKDECRNVVEALKVWAK